MEGSEGPVASQITKTTKTETVQIESTEEKSTRRSIIEEWRNPLERADNVIKSDQLYEERAVDVNIEQHPRQDLPKRRDQGKIQRGGSNVVKTASAMTQTNNRRTIGDRENGVIKIKRPQGGGTVRNIPIKDYEASLAQDFGTFRKSMLPQRQFKALISESGRSLPKIVSKKKKPDNPPIRTTTFNADGAKARASESRPTELSRGYEIHSGLPRDLVRGSQRRSAHFEAKKVAATKEGANSSQERDEESNRDFIDPDEYFRRDSPRQSRFRHDRSDKSDTWKVSAKCPPCGEASLSKRENVDLTRGHVGQKISVYEENSRDGKRDSKRKLAEMRKRSIGVPLVGMHNACGLPVIASWPSHVLGPVQVSSRIVGNLTPLSGVRPIVRNVKTFRRTRPKRRAPDRPTSNIRESVLDGRKAATAYLSEGRTNPTSNGCITKKILRRPSFKTSKKTNTAPVKRSFPRLITETVKSDTGLSQKLKKRSSIGTFGRRSLKRRSLKRATLYAKADGNDAVRALTNLCLNPLARTKEDAEMMW